MVYYGPSRACTTCKKRRKNCDKTRPSCLRCIKANRTCIGYEDGVAWTFRPYETPQATFPAEFRTRARKCSLPRRALVPGTNAIIADVDVAMSEITQEQMIDYAMRAFFYDFCINLPGSGGPRGYLAKLETMADDLGPGSLLAKACQAVTYVTHGQSLLRPRLIHDAEALYHNALGSLAGAIERSSVTAEPRTVAMLLGIYEIAKPRRSDTSDHITHAKGLAALLNTGQSPGILLNRLSSRLLQVEPCGDIAAERGHTLFPMPKSDDQFLNIDTLLLELDMLWTRYKASEQLENIHALLSECTVLQRRFENWANDQAPEARPTAVTNLSYDNNASSVSVGCWPSRVDTYSDIYIAGVWNIARVAQLLLFILILKISDELGDTHAQANLMCSINTIVEAVLSSIPYHLTDNLYDFLDSPTSGIAEPGKTLGGLLLVYPLYLVSLMPFVCEPVKTYLRSCLSWVATNMGIGHAERLAKSRDIDEESIVSGCMIIWAGFLRECPTR